MTTSLLRAAIIGCGPFNETRGGCNSVGYAHAAAIRNTSGISLVAAASRTPKNIADFCGEFPGTAGYTDYREMLAAERPDWVSVCAFPPDREAMCLAALEAGAKILLVEKPFAVTAAAMRSILTAPESKGARVFVNHQRRYGKWFEWFREQVRTQACGELKALTLYHGGLGFINFGPHLIDAALFALEPRRPVSVQAAVDWTDAGDYQGVRTEKSILADILFDDGVHLTLHSGPDAGKGQPCLRAACAGGLVELYFGPFGPTRAIGRVVGERVTSPDFGTEHFHHNDTAPNVFYDRAVQDMVACYRNGTPCRVDARLATVGTAILLGAYESARLGTPVALG
jgi:predicted dehydrogenase